jgi:hypothetical protein
MNDIFVSSQAYYEYNHYKYADKYDNGWVEADFVLTLPELPFAAIRKETVRQFWKQK